MEQPAAAEYLSPALAVVFAAVLSGCLWLALAPPRGLVTDRLAHGFGAAAAMGLGLGLLVTARLGGDAAVWVLFGPPAIFFAASALADGISQSFHAGVEAAAWIGLIGVPLVFVVWLPESSYRYAIDAQLFFDGDGGYPVGMNLSDAIWILVVTPVLSLPVRGDCRGRWRRTIQAPAGP